uniref:Transthyretin/hydroxyisourate hydrolase domain-containing protein n=1 Tax=Panagrellus redivivus TaxID=6233 RepID=A0A7E4W238_PANRE
MSNCQKTTLTCTMSTSVAFLLVTLAVCGVSVHGIFQQWVGVSGQVTCGDAPASGTQIKLWNKNTGFDDQLASVHADSNGNFNISGGEGALFSMDVHIKFYTKCNRNLPCDRIIDFKVPSQYVTRGNSVANWYNLGTVNLMTKTKDENHKCL